MAAAAQDVDYMVQEAISIAGGDLADYNPAVDAVDELLDDVAGRRLLQVYIQVSRATERYAS